MIVQGGKPLATAISKPRVRTRSDRIFFQIFTVLIGVAVFVGFAQTYYLHGILRVPAFKAILAPPFPLIVHIHAALFSAWIILLITQTSLIAAHLVDLHRRLGLFGFGLACLMIPVTLAAICAEMVRLSPRLPWGQVADITVFAILIYFAYRQRRNPAAHKRLMLIATITLLDAPIARWPFLPRSQYDTPNMCCFFLLLLIAGYDFFSTGRVHRATLWGAALSIASKYPVSYLLSRHIRADQLTHSMQALGHFLR
jgi:hypothetical protein